MEQLMRLCQGEALEGECDSDSLRLVDLLTFIIVFTAAAA
jgi:hypothetical protein